MRIILFIILFINGFYTFGIGIDTSIFKLNEYFNTELKSFIDTVKPNTIGKGKYMVIVANFYKIDKKNNEFCFCLGVIMNEFELKYMQHDLIYYYNNEIVLIQLPKETDKIILKELNVKSIDKTDSVNIISKLFHESKGGITGTSEGLLFCYKKKSIEKTFYKNADKIPFDKYIYRKFPTGGVIKQIEDKH